MIPHHEQLPFYMKGERDNTLVTPKWDWLLLQIVESRNKQMLHRLKYCFNWHGIKCSWNGTSLTTNELDIESKRKVDITLIQQE